MAQPLLNRRPETQAEVGGVVRRLDEVLQSRGFLLVILGVIFCLVLVGGVAENLAHQYPLK